MSAVKCLDLRFLTDRENNRMSGWIDMEPDDVTLFVDELWVVGELELLHPMRSKAVSAPNALDGTSTEAYGFAINAAVQWVISAGGSVCVSTTTRSEICDPSGGMREGRVLSRRRPS
jgi:hypothetical protein